MIVYMAVCLEQILNSMYLLKSDKMFMMYCLPGYGIYGTGTFTTSTIL